MRPTGSLLDDLSAQGRFIAKRSPVYARILELIPEIVPFDSLDEVWAGRTFEAWYDRPLLLLAALRYDALAEGAGHPLHRAIGAGADADAATPDALRAAFARSRGVWRSLRTRFVQTNETSRAVAWMWPAHMLAAARPGRAVCLFDIGASAGLNLVADALPRPWSRSSGGLPLAIDPLPSISLRRGFDRHPIDVHDADGARWLRACIWPGEPARQDRLERAIAAWRVSSPRPDLVAARAGDVPALLPRDGDIAIAYQTVMRDYLPEEERVRYDSGMRTWLRSRPAGDAVWIEMEVTVGAKTGGGPSGSLTVHGRDASFALASCDAHPSVLSIDDAAVDALGRYLASRS